MKSFLARMFAMALVATAAVGCNDARSASASTAKIPAKAFDIAALRKIIEENNRRFTAAHVTGDAPVIDNMFTLDAKCLPPESEPIIGRAAIAKLTAQYIEAGISEFREETTDFYGNAELLVDQGNYVIVYGKEKTVEKGKYMNVWRREDGAWKIYSNMWNTNAPAAPAR